MKFWQRGVFAFLFLMGGCALAKEKPALTAGEIPGMSLLLTQIQGLALTPAQKNLILKLITPSSERRYYNVAADFLDPHRRRQLIEEYAALLQIPESQVILYAVTNAGLGRTVLFPEFADLKPLEAQAALLLHESLWLLPQKAHIEDVIEIERAARALFEDATSADNNLKFYDQISHIFPKKEHLSIIWRSSIAFDKMTLPLRIPAKQAFGQEFLDCWRNTGGPFVLCRWPLVSELMKINTQSESLFYRALFEYFLNQGFVKLPPVPKSFEDMDLVIREKPGTNLIYFELVQRGKSLGFIEFGNQ